MDEVAATVCVASCLVWLTGCGAHAPGRVHSLQAANRQLDGESRAQQAEIENLRAHTKRLEAQLRETEKLLARLEGSVVGDTEKLTTLRQERLRLRKALGGSAAPEVAGGGALARLAAHYPNLQVDPATGIGKVRTDILFQEGETELQPAAKAALRDLAAALERDEAHDLKILVAGHTDNQRIAGPAGKNRPASNWHLSTSRAQAVAQELLDAGVDGRRIGIAGFGMHQPVTANDDYRARQANRRVEIFVTSPHVPVVGMTDTLTNLY